jgi:uncharacterized protein (UPF0303 family)
MSSKPDTQDDSAGGEAELLRQEQVELEWFGHDEAWELGVWLRDRLVSDGTVGAVAVYLGDQRAFVGSVSGSSSDLDLWLDRKARTVRIWGHSSLWVKQHFGRLDPDFASRVLQDSRQIAAAGGGFPIRIRGAIVGVACCSGWTEEGEHGLAFEAVHTMAKRQQLKRTRE